MRTVIVGAGMGGLAAAIVLARAGRAVTVLEARSEPGGLASGIEAEGHAFDGGPYILLDKPGLELAFEHLGLDLAELGALVRLDPVWTVQHHALEEPLAFHADRAETAAELERHFPGIAPKYLRFVEAMARHEARLRPMLERSRPKPWHLLASNAILSAPLLLSNVGSQLRRAGLPAPLVDILGIWTHVAGQELDEAPSPLCFVPAMVHASGAYVPQGGMRAIPQLLAKHAARLGVELRYGVKVARIATTQGRVAAVISDDGERFEARSVMSNAGALATYLKLLDSAPPRSMSRWMQRLPLQSPGICVYLVARRRQAGSQQTKRSYLSFRLPGEGELCRLRVDNATFRHEPGPWTGLRLIVPMRQAEAEPMSEQDERALAARLAGESWLHDEYEDLRCVALRTPKSWGSTFSLYANAMNPTMTAAFMRRGRFAHRAPYVSGLYLVGSSTHPGQWVSFCALSGCLAVSELLSDEAA